MIGANVNKPSPPALSRFAGEGALFSLAPEGGEGRGEG